MVHRWRLVAKGVCIDWAVHTWQGASRMTANRFGATMIYFGSLASCVPDTPLKTCELAHMFRDFTKAGVHIWRTCYIWQQPRLCLQKVSDFCWHTNSSELVLFWAFAAMLMATDCPNSPKAGTHSTVPGWTCTHIMVTHKILSDTSWHYPLPHHKVVTLSCCNKHTRCPIPTVKGGMLLYIKEAEAI